MSKSLLLIGSGPGIGSHTARHFASQGFTTIHLLSRSSTTLSAASTLVQSAPNASSSLKVHTHAVDLTDLTALQSTLDSVPVPEVIIFNAARVGPSTLGAFSTNEVLDDFKTVTLALYAVSNWAMLGLVALAESKSSSVKPSLLATSGGLHDYPLPAFFSLSLAKAAQINLLESLRLIYGSQGVHVASVDVQGIVKSEAEDAVLSPVNIAKSMYEVYEQGKGESAADGEVIERTVGDMKVLSGLRGVKSLG